jgi:hypothetical protein
MIDRADHTVGELQTRRDMTFGRQLRYLVFGPLIYTILAMARTIYDERNLGREFLAAIPLSILFLAFAYFVGSLPAFLVGHMDELLFRRRAGIAYRLPLCSSLAVVLLCGPWVLLGGPIKVVADACLLTLITTSACCILTNRAFEK